MLKASEIDKINYTKIVELSTPHHTKMEMMMFQSDSYEISYNLVNRLPLETIIKLLPQMRSEYVQWLQQTNGVERLELTKDVKCLYSHIYLSFVVKYFTEGLFRDLTTKQYFDYFRNEEGFEYSTEEEYQLNLTKWREYEPMVRVWNEKLTETQKRFNGFFRMNLDRLGYEIAKFQNQYNTTFTNDKPKMLQTDKIQYGTKIKKVAYVRQNIKRFVEEIIFDVFKNMSNEEIKMEMSKYDIQNDENGFITNDSLTMDVMMFDLLYSTDVKVGIFEERFNTKTTIKQWEKKDNSPLRLWELLTNKNQ